MKKTLWKNKLNFVKDVPTKCVNFITTVSIVSEEKTGGITFVPPRVRWWQGLDVVAIHAAHMPTPAWQCSVYSQILTFAYVT
jgi:hypothetical protein